MPVPVSPWEVTRIVTLVNDWGTLPLQIGDREAPARPAESDVADQLFAVFAADPPERARLVSTMLSETQARPQLIEVDGGYEAAWSVPDGGSAVIASAALGLRDHLVKHPDRLGVCADRQCSDVYVDVSQAGHRRFCSTTCQTRTRVSTFRDRRRQRDDTSSPADAGRPGAA